MGLFDLKRGKRGQIALFIIIGIFMLIGVGIFFYFKSIAVHGELDKGQIRTRHLAEIKQSVTFAVEDCVDSLINTYVFTNGVNVTATQKYINDNFQTCIDLDELILDSDITVTNGTFFAKVSEGKEDGGMFTDSLITKISYPIKLEASYGQMDFEEFNVDYKLYAEIPLRINNGKTVDYSMVSKGDISFTIEDGTTVVMPNGAPAKTGDKIRVKIINFPSSTSSSTALGPVYFDITPKGVVFSPETKYAKLKYKYDTSFLNGEPEGSIRLGWKDGNLWHPYRTDVFENDDYIIGHIDIIK